MHCMYHGYYFEALVNYAFSISCLPINVFAGPHLTLLHLVTTVIVHFEAFFLQFTINRFDIWILWNILQAPDKPSWYTPHQCLWLDIFVDNCAGSHCGTSPNCHSWEDGYSSTYPAI